MAQEKKTAEEKNVKLEEVKLKEEELQEVPAAPIADPVPATEAEVEAAVDPAAIPAVEPAAEVEAPVEEPVEAVTPDQAMFTPPAEGYVPAGWVKIEDLAAAVAQATGDVEAASVAPDAQDATVEGAPIDTEAAIPAAATDEQPLVAPVQEACGDGAEDKMEEAKDAGECAEEAVAEDEKAGEEYYNNEDLPDEAKITEAEDVCPGCGKNPCECEEGKMEEAVEDEAAVEDEVIDDVEDDLGGVEADAVEEAEKDIEDNEDNEDIGDVEVDIEDSAMDQMLAEPTEEDMDLLDKISAFLDDVETDAEEDKAEAEETVGEIADAAIALQNSSDFLKSLVQDDEDYGVDVTKFGLTMVDDDEDVEDEEDVEEDFDDEDIEEDFEEDMDRIPVDLPDNEIEQDVIDRKEGLEIKESYEGFLPAGSEHFAEENIVESYEKSAAARRRALAKFRESLKSRRDDEGSQKFAEALKGSSKMYTVYDDDTKSWSSNRFEEKFEERQKLNYRELLENGFLG